MNKLDGELLKLLLVWGKKSQAMARREIDQDISILVKFDRNCNLLEMEFITARGNFEAS
jgi:hypothetical protein